MRSLSRRVLLGGAGIGLGLALAGCGDEEPLPDGRGSKTVTYNYGDDASQYAELYIPEGEVKGVAVIIHGGFWAAAYGLELGRPLATDLLKHGWASWNIEYRRIGNGGGTPETFDDVTAALDELAKRDVNLSKVVLIGHSAGGHLAAWAADHPIVTGVIAQAGVLDLEAAAEQNLGGGAVSGLLGHDYGTDDAQWDPIKQVPLKVPVWCLHAKADALVPYEQSESYVAAATAAGATAELVTVPGDHFTLIDPSTPAWNAVVTILEGL